MNIETMRKVDYFAGIPLCFLATLLVRFVDLLRRRQRQHPKRVLFLELSEMGSTILADPAMRKMQEVGHAQPYFLIFAANAASPRLLTGSADGNLVMWLWRSEDLRDEACRRLTRNLDAEEWARYLGDRPYRSTCQNPGAVVPSAAPAVSASRR